MKKTIRLTESELHGLIRECIEEIIYENRQPLTEAFQSQKLAKLVQQHGGIDKDSRLGKKLFKNSSRYLYDINDNQVLGTSRNLQRIKDVYGKEIENDMVYTLLLKDGTYLAIKAFERPPYVGYGSYQYDDSYNARHVGKDGSLNYDYEDWGDSEPDISKLRQRRAGGIYMTTALRNIREFPGTDYLKKRLSIHKPEIRKNLEDYGKYAIEKNANYERLFDPDAI